MCTFTSTVSKASHSLEIRTSRLSKNLNRPTHGAAKYMTTKRAFPSFPKGFPLHVSYSTNLHGHRMAQDPSWKPLKEPRTLLFEGVLAGKTTRLTAPRKKVRNKSDHSNWSCKTKPFNFCKTPIFFLDWIATAGGLEHGSRNSENVRSLPQVGCGAGKSSLSIKADLIDATKSSPSYLLTKPLGQAFKLSIYPYTRPNTTNLQNATMTNIRRVKWRS